MSIMLAHLRRVSVTAQPAIMLIERWLTPCFDLGIRVYIASVFLPSGWLKLTSWDSTLALFESDYRVPLLSTDLAAILATSGELLFPLLLVLGLAGRLGAAGLSVINLVAVLAYSDLSDLGRQDHLLWGVLLLVTLLHGPGRFSCDQWINRPQT